uniref:Ring finger protein 25 n=1 Tax=Gadus morhua TaxID=8049 RepID=A0A8C5FPV5_GADMO
MAFLRPLQFTYLCGYNLSRNGSLGHDSISTFSPSFQQYPSSPPSISIHNPRGLSDDMLSSVLSCLQAEAESCLGSPVLYQLIEKAKEILTESNIPHGNCVICLYGFKESEAFTKTSCYHYFHSHCLGRYVTHSEEEVRQRQKEQEQDKTQHRAERQGLMVVCPVCREPLTYDAGQLLSSPAPLFPQQEGAAMGTDFVQKWRELQELLERQRAKGGIIDPDVESNRFLIHINEVSATRHQRGDARNECRGRGGCLPFLICTLCTLTGGGPGHRRHGPFRGPRRGGRGRPHPPPGRPSPPTEGLDKLHLPSDGGAHPLPSAQGPLRPRPRGPPKGADAEPAPAKTDKEDPADREHREPPDSADKPPLRQPTPGDPDPPAADGEPDGGPDKRGRRRGHRPGQWHERPERHARGTNQWDPQGGWHPRWEGRGSGCRGGGPRRGPSRGSSHQKVQERDAGWEEVL